MDPRDDSLGVTWLASRYQVAGLRARGALCLVYQGQDAVLQRPVAIKAPLETHADAYRAMLEATSTLAHPAFLALYDVVQQGGALFLAYEFVDGRPLTDYLAAGLPLRRALAVILQVIRAISYAHAHGVTHGDLTPAAIFVDRTATARIANVGMEPDDSYFDEIATSAFASTVADSPDASATILTQHPQRLDVWAVAALFWRLVTDANEQSSVPEATDISARARVYRPDTPETVRSVIERTLRVSHPEPIESAEELATMLAALQAELAGSGMDAEEPVPPTILALRAQRKRASDAVAATVGVSGVRWMETGAQSASPTATTSFGEVNRAAIVPLDGNTTQPSRDHAHDEEYAAQAPRLSLPSRPIGAPNSRLLDARRLQVASHAAGRATRDGLGVWVWTLISLAVFALCFLIGFFLAGVAIVPTLR